MWFQKVKRQPFTYKLVHKYFGETLSKCTNEECPLYDVCTNGIIKENLDLPVEQFDDVDSTITKINNNGTIITTITHCPGLMPSTKTFIYDSITARGVFPRVDTTNKIQITTIKDGVSSVLLEFGAYDNKFVLTDKSYIKVKPRSLKQKDINTFEIAIADKFILVVMNGKEFKIKNDIIFRGQTIEMLENGSSQYRELPFTEVEIAVEFI